MKSYEYRMGFLFGATIMREMLARFVEQGGDPVIAQSIRANWNPNWCIDPGVVPDDIYELSRNFNVTESV